MVFNNNGLKKYYSIKEVAEQFDVNASALRYWETEFPFLRPKITGNNIRQYTEKDIEKVRLIHNLLKVRGFKIASARKILGANPTGADNRAYAIDTLINVRDQLLELKNHLDSL